MNVDVEAEVWKRWMFREDEAEIDVVDHSFKLQATASSGACIFGMHADVPSSPQQHFRISRLFAAKEVSSGILP